MSEVAVPPAPSARSRTNTVIQTAEWDVVFFEAHDPEPPEAGAEGGRWTFNTRAIRSEPERGRDKWLYVLAANLDDGGLVARASLQVEGHYDADGALRLVDWSGGAGAWVGHDDRPATVERPGGVVPLSFRVDGSAPGGVGGVAPPDGGRSVYLAFLSHVQLPAARLDRYTGEWARGHLADRALLLDPSDLAPDGTGGGEAVGYGPTATDARVRAGHGWVQASPDGPRPYAAAVLVDYVDVAAELQSKVGTALNRLDAYDITVAEKSVHAAVTRSVAAAYARSEGKAPGDVPGRPLAKIRAFEAERQPYVDEVELWADRLYGYHMRLRAFELAREDATDFGPIDGLSDDQVLAVEAEAERQAELLDGASRSVAGGQFLRDAFAGGTLRSGWYGTVVFSSKIVRQLGKAAIRAYKPGVKAAWTELKTVAAKTDLADLEARRVRTHALYLQATEQTRLQRGVTDQARAAIEAIQTEVLEELARTPETSLALPGTAAYEETLSEVVRSARTRGPVDLDAVFREGPRRPGFRPRPAPQIIGASPAAGAAPAQGAFVFLDPRVWRRPGQGGSAADARFRQFRVTEVLPSGVVLLGDGARTAVARGGPPAPRRPPPPTTVQRKVVAIETLRRQLFDAEGDLGLLADDERAAGRAHGRARARLAAERATLRGAEAELDFRVTRLTTAGRLTFVLGLFGAVESTRTFWRELREGNERRADGADYLSAYLGAFGAGAGAASGVAGSVDAWEAVNRRAAVAIADRTTLGRGLKVFGIAAGVLTMVASSIALYEEHEAHDGWGQVSAGLAFASGLAGSSVALAYVLGHSAWWLPYLGYAGVALAIVSIAVLLLSNTPIEDWLESSLWSSEESHEGLSGPALTRKVDADLRALVRIVSVPLVSLEFWDDDGTLATYGSTSRPVPARVRLVVRPGYMPPGAVLDVEDVHLRLPSAMDTLGDYVPFMEGSGRERVTVASGVTLGDPTATVYVTPGASAPGAYLREWGLEEGGLSDRARGYLRMAPAGVGFGCTVRVRPADGGDGPVPAVTFRLRGNVGYARTTDGTKVSVAYPVED